MNIRMSAILGPFLETSFVFFHPYMTAFRCVIRIQNVNFLGDIQRYRLSGVTTMGSDRENPGAPHPQWAKWGPQAQAIDQKHCPGPLICYNVVF